MRQRVHDWRPLTLSAGFWWLVKVMVATVSPLASLEILRSLSPKSTVERYPVLNFWRVMAARNCAPSRFRYPRKSCPLIAVKYCPRNVTTDCDCGSAAALGLSVTVLLGAVADGVGAAVEGDGAADGVTGELDADGTGDWLTALGEPAAVECPGTGAVADALPSG